MKKRARAADARPRQAAARPRLPPADGLLPAAGRRGAADRADRDRDAGRRSTRSPRRSPRSCARAPRTRRSRATRRTRRRSAGSTRPAPPSARSSASRSTEPASTPARDAGVADVGRDARWSGLDRVSAAGWPRTLRFSVAALGSLASTVSTSRGGLHDVQDPHWPLSAATLVLRRHAARRRRHRQLRRRRRAALTQDGRRSTGKTARSFKRHLHDRALHRARAASSYSVGTLQGQARAARRSRKDNVQHARRRRQRRAPARAGRRSCCRRSPERLLDPQPRRSGRSTSTCSACVVRTNQIDAAHRRRPGRRATCSATCCAAITGLLNPQARSPTRRSASSTQILNALLALVPAHRMAPARRADRVAATRPQGAAAVPCGRSVVIFSGIQPTGRKHLGNYIGAIMQYVAGQDRGDPAIYCIVDLHAHRRSTTTPPSCASARYDTAALLVAAGLDPERCILFRQGDVHGAHRADAGCCRASPARRAQPHAPVPRQVGRAARAGRRPGCSSTRC